MVKDRGSRANVPEVLEQEAQARQQVAGMGKREFLEQYQRLAKQYTVDPGNPGSYACEGCERCANCMFCKDCDSCYQCTHCTRCELCNNCSHCVDCKQCHNCAYCVQSENCTSSAYLVLCRNMSDSNYCFGSVGLSKKDFHILNVPFPRTEYFKQVKRLRAEMGI
ncbi:caib/baif family protein [Archangium violaceum]|uniref:caib/baif family protein n=1 Tax=Archangium violaceum TaxID=83451 RepID=UPI002B2EC7D4|nr:caib/baif family protein [Archangium gephyra]